MGDIDAARGVVVERALAVYRARLARCMGPPPHPNIGSLLSSLDSACDVLVIAERAEHVRIEAEEARQNAEDEARDG